MNIMHFILTSNSKKEPDLDFCDKLDKLYENLKIAGAQTLDIGSTGTSEIDLYVETEEEDFDTVIKAEFESLGIGKLIAKNQSGVEESIRHEYSLA